MATFASSYRASTWYAKKGGSKYVRRAGESMSRAQRQRISFSGIADLFDGLAVSVQHSVAKNAAPMLTRMALGSWDAGRNVYDDVRPLGVNGNVLTLYRKGKTKKSTAFVTSGTIVRCKLGTDYARWLIGRYGILPNGKAKPPVKWQRGLKQLADAEMGVR